MDRQNIIEPESRNGKLEPVHKDKFMVKLLHKKYSVIHLAESQMSNLQQKYATRTSRRSNKYLRKLWRRRYCLLILFFIVLLAWLCIMYGIVLGTVICGRCNTHGHIPLIRIPGLNVLREA